MQIEQTERNIEAVLFASGEPVELAKLCEALEIDEKTAKGLIEHIRERYIGQNSPFDIIPLGDSYQMCTLPGHAEIIRKVMTLKRSAVLSQAALEVLAVIAYNQPVTRSFVEQVRGVDCSAIIRSLSDKALIEEAGRLPIPGKPISYRTTMNFLRAFGLESLEQLPDLPDADEAPPEPEVENDQLEGQMDFFE